MRSVLLIIGWLLLPAVSAGAEPAYREWAVIATPTVLESGLADLLTVQLSQDETIHLVERERVRDATRELQLTALVSGKNVGQRLRLGETVGADALMVLSTERSGEQDFVRIVVCDAALGVRLWDEQFANDANIEQLAKQFTTVVDEVRQRYAAGFRHIIAIPPFLSDNFEHHFEYLQSRYSDRLSATLASHAGVAVVEIEEAHAVLRELEATLAGGLARPIATIVEGRYRVNEPDGDGRRWIDLHIQLVSGDKREVLHKRSRSGMVGHWLTTSLAKRLLPTDDNRSDSLNVKAQKAILARHAHRFAELGDWERSTSLRETALILDPGDVTQRSLLISEYQYLIGPLVDANWNRSRFAKPLPLEARAAALRQAADDYVVGLNHLEYLVRNGLVARGDAVGLLYSHRWYSRNGVGPGMWDELRSDALRPACVARRAFFRNVGEEIEKLPRGRLLPERFSTPFYGLSNTVLQDARHDVLFSNHSAGSLESLRFVLEHVLPENAKVSDVVLSLMTRYFMNEERQDREEYFAQRAALRQAEKDAEDDVDRKLISKQLLTLLRTGVSTRSEEARKTWRAYLTDLTQSDRVAVRFYGQYGLLRSVETQSRSLSEPDAYATLVREVRAATKLIDNLQAQLAELEQQERVREQTVESVTRLLTSSRTRVAAVKDRIDLYRPTTSARLYENPSEKPARVRAKPYTAPVAKPRAPDRMQLEPIALRIEGDDDPAPSLAIRGLLQCGQQCDAFWTKERFFVMREAGVLREVKLTDATADFTLFWEVAWDGECIWLHCHGQGIVAIHPDGTRVATLGPEDLPGYWKGHKLLGLSPRQALMVGSFAESRRAWCAILQVDDAGQSSVNVFHQAKYVAQGRAQTKASANPQTAFRPTGLYQVRYVDGRDYVLVGRDGLSSLVIDLDTLQVTATAQIEGGASTRTDLGYSGDYFLRDGRQLRPNSGLANLSTSKRMVYHDGWIYRPGYVWMRMNVETRKQERLHTAKLPHADWHLRPGVSAHYGLVAYDPYRRVFNRVKIRDEKAEPVEGAKP